MSGRKESVLNNKSLRTPASRDLNSAREEIKVRNTEGNVFGGVTKRIIKFDCTRVCVLKGYEVQIFR